MKKDQTKYIAIRDVVIDLIVTEGLSGTSMSKIAKRVGISQSTIYVYFKSKEEMINSIYLSAKVDFSKYLLKNIDFNRSEEATFKDIWLNLFKYIMENPNIFCFLEQFEHSPLINKLEEEEIMGIYFSEIFKFIERAKEKKVIRNLPKEFLRSFAIGPISHIVRLHVKGAVQINQNIINEMLDMSWQAIKI
jgi:AcrR family transcriptional regulator